MMKSIHYNLPNTIVFPPLLLQQPPLINPFSQTLLNKPNSINSFSHLHLNTKLSVIQDDGPIELSPDIPSIFATNDDPTPLQITSSLLLTGAITVFLFRSIRRRAKRAKDLRVRSSGVKTLKEEALDSLKAIGDVSIESKKTPSPIQALLGGLTAGVLALILYKFTITIEAALNRQPLSDSFSARQITVTIRTIINGLCYLATFIFGFNSIGLFLYAGQLALNSSSEDSTDGDAKINNDKNEARSPDLSADSPNNRENSDSDQTSS